MLEGVASKNRVDRYPIKASVHSKRLLTGG